MALPPLSDLRAIAIAAGHKIMPYFQANPVVQTKADDSPVTEADIASHEYLCGELQRLTPGLRILSEEGVGAPVESDAPFWLVDPLDGTREFVNGIPEFTVNIAYIKDGRPTLAVVAVPPSGLCYSAELGTGAWRQDGTGQNILIHTRKFDEKNLAAYISRNGGQTTTAKVKARWPGATLKPCGSALKLCWLAEGLADFYFREHPSMGWDTAAPDLLLAEAGGQMIDFQGQPLRYTTRSEPNPAWLAVGDPNFNWRKF